MANYYLSSVLYSAVAAWAPDTAYVLGALVRQRTSPGVGYERVFRCSTPGTSGNKASEPAWSAVSIARGATVRDNTAVWTECTGQEAYQGATARWAAPFARYQTAVSSGFTTSSDIIYRDVNHQETQRSAMGVPTIVGYKRIITVTPSTSRPPAIADKGVNAGISTTGASSINFDGNDYQFMDEGGTFTAGDGENRADVKLSQNSANMTMQFRKAIFALGNTNAASCVSAGADINTVDWLDVSVKFRNAKQGISVGRARLTWRNTKYPVLAAGSIVPTNLFIQGAYPGHGRVLCENLDFSAFTNPLVKASTFTYPSTIVFHRCKIPLGAVSDMPAKWGGDIYLVECDSGTNYQRHEKYSKQGTLTLEPNCVRSGGVKNSWKVVTAARAANITWNVPFDCFPLAVWNGTTGTNRRITVYGIWNNATLPNNDDIWIEVLYFGDASTPLGSWATSGISVRGAPNARVALDGSAWLGSVKAGMSSPKPFRLVATLSSPQPKAAGLIEVRIRIAKSSATFYLDPNVVIE